MGEGPRVVGGAIGCVSLAGTGEASSLPSVPAGPQPGGWLFPLHKEAAGPTHHTLDRESTFTLELRRERKVEGKATRR